MDFIVILNLISLKFYVILLFLNLIGLLKCFLYFWFVPHIRGTNADIYNFSSSLFTDHLTIWRYVVWRTANVVKLPVSIN